MTRPTDYSQELADRVCELISGTPRGLDYICEHNEDLPSSRTVHRWLAANDAFRQSYLRAREAQADLLFDECLEIADDSSRDTKTVGSDANEREVTDTEVLGRSKLRVDTRLRMAGKLSPKKYGDKLDIETKDTTSREQIEMTTLETARRLGFVLRRAAELQKKQAVVIDNE